MPVTFVAHAVRTKKEETSVHLASLQQILIWMDQYRYWIIFPFTIIEGPIVTVMGGFLVSVGRLDWITLFLVALAGDVIGDLGHYAFGRWLYRGIFFRYGKRLGKTGETIENGIGYVRENPFKAIVFGKLTQVTGFAILIASGAAKIPVWKFFWYCVAGSAPKLPILMAVGYFFGSAYERIDTYAGKTSFVAFVMLSISIAFFLRKKRSGKLSPASSPHSMKPKE